MTDGIINITYRKIAIKNKIPYITTMTAVLATAKREVEKVKYITPYIKSDTIYIAKCVSYLLEEVLWKRILPFLKRNSLRPL